MYTQSIAWLPFSSPFTSVGCRSCPAMELIFSQWRSRRPGLNRAAISPCSSLKSSTRVLVCVWSMCVGELCTCTLYSKYKATHLLCHLKWVGTLREGLLHLVERPPHGSDVILDLVWVHATHRAIHPLTVDSRKQSAIKIHMYMCIYVRISHSLMFILELYDGVIQLVVGIKDVDQLVPQWVL